MPSTDVGPVDETSKGGGAIVIDLSGPLGHEVHARMDAAFETKTPLAVDAGSGAPIVLGYCDVERLAHDRNLVSVGTAMFRPHGDRGEPAAPVDRGSDVSRPQGGDGD